MNEWYNRILNINPICANLSHHCQQICISTRICHAKLLWHNICSDNYDMMSALSKNVNIHMSTQEEKKMTDEELNNVAEETTETPESNDNVAVL